MPARVHECDATREYLMVPPWREPEQLTWLLIKLHILNGRGIRMPTRLPEAPPFRPAEKQVEYAHAMTMHLCQIRGHVRPDRPD